MPIMSNLSDIVGLNRQISVLAFQLGDGFSNLFWPTAVAVECGIAGVPLDKWYKFITPLFGIMMILEVIFILILLLLKEISKLQQVLHSIGRNTIGRNNK